MKETTFKALISAAGGALLAYFKIMAVPIAILLIVMGADYLSGMTKAWMNSELSSSKGMKGIVKKLCYMLVVIVAACVDWLVIEGLAMIGLSIGKTYYFGVMVCIWLIINELISILENLDAIGVPLPRFLVTMVKRLKNTVDKTDKEEKS